MGDGMINVEEHLGLANKIACKFMNRGDLEDIRQMAYEGLVKASNRFDERLGYKFSTYATIVIENTIKRELRDGYFRRLKCRREIGEMAGKIVYFMSYNNYDIVHDANIICNEFNITNEDLQAIFNYQLNLDLPLCGSNSTLSDIISTGKDEFDNKEIEMIIEGLDENLKEVIRLRYYNGMKQVEVAKELGTSQVQVSRLEARAIKKLRAELRVC